MLSLTEILHNKNVLFSYYGYIDKEVNKHVLSITKSQLEKRSEKTQVIKRVYNAINECVENIIKHHFFPKDGDVYCKSLIMISETDKGYSIETINVVTELQKNVIEQQLQSLVNKTRDELKELKSSLVTSGKYSEKDTAGLGLVDMILRTDTYHYRFNPHNSNFLFNIHFQINSQN